MARLSLRPRCQIGEVSERFAELRRMGIRTVMITGDNAMTAAAIAAEAGVDDFRAGDLSVDLVRRIVKTGEREVKLSPKEHDCCGCWCSTRARC
jgi:high-affinity K+ transport system ATPase subunit B